MTLAAVKDSGFSHWPSLPAFPIAAVLRLPPLLAVWGSPISPPRLPLPPPACLLAARLTAIACQRLLGPEDASAAFQQTDPPPGTTSPTLAPGDLSRGLIFRRSWAIFTRGHGRCYSQKLKPRRGHTFPFGAPSMHREGLNLATLPQNSDPIRRVVVRTERPPSSDERLLLGWVKSGEHAPVIFGERLSSARERRKIERISYRYGGLRARF